MDSLVLPKRAKPSNFTKASMFGCQEMHAKDHEELHLSSLYLPCGPGPHFPIASVLSAPSFGQSRPRGIKPVLKSGGTRHRRGKCVVSLSLWTWLTVL